MLHSGESGVSLFVEQTVATFFFSAAAAPPSGGHGPLQRSLMSCVAEHLANPRREQGEGIVILELDICNQYLQLLLNQGP